MIDVDFEKELSPNDAQIKLPPTFYSKRGDKASLRTVPEMRSLMLTAANHIFLCFLDENVRVARKTLNDKYYMPEKVASSSFSGARVRSILLRDAFLISLSSMLSYILSFDDYRATVTVCSRCVRNMSKRAATRTTTTTDYDDASASDESTITSTNDKIKNVSIANFFCDEKSKEAITNFARHLANKGILLVPTNETKRNVPFGALFTYTADGFFPPWTLLTWLWIHQVFAAVGSVRNAINFQNHIYLLVKTMVFKVFVQIRCKTCSRHAFASYIEAAFENDLRNYLMPNSSVKVWNDYGFCVHSIINTRIMYGSDGSGVAAVIAYEEFQTDVLPFLLKHPLRDLIGSDALAQNACASELAHESELNFEKTFFARDFDDGELMEAIFGNKVLERNDAIS